MTKQNKTCADITAEYKALKSAANDYIKSATPALIEALAKEVAALLKTDGLFTKMRWSQYTPSFCDGDPCYFQVSEPEALDNDSWKSWYNEAEEPLKKASFDKIQGLIGNIDRDLLERMFGDGYEITIDSEGRITIDRYSEY